MSRIAPAAVKDPHPGVARRHRAPATMRVIRGELAVDVHSTLGTLFVRLGSPEAVEILADVGLGFLFLLAGYEVD